MEFFPRHQRLHLLEQLPLFFADVVRKLLSQASQARFVKSSVGCSSEHFPERHVFGL